MAAGMVVTRRAFLADLGWGGVAVALVSLVGCAPSQASGTPVAATDTAAGSGVAPPRARTTRAVGASVAPPSSTPAASASGATASGDPAGALGWERVNLGFVSAYVLVRGGEAAIVDTGVAGSEGAIEDGPRRRSACLGRGRPRRRDPQAPGPRRQCWRPCSIERPGRPATSVPATSPRISAPRPLTALRDGERVFGLQVVETPGHTAGHISVLDEVAGVLVAGDALGRTGGTLARLQPAVHRGRGGGAGDRREARQAPLRDPAGRARRSDPDRRLGQVAALGRRQGQSTGPRAPAARGPRSPARRRSLGGREASDPGGLADERLEPSRIDVVAGVEGQPARLLGDAATSEEADPGRSSGRHVRTRDGRARPRARSTRRTWSCGRSAGRSR